MHKAPLQNANGVVPPCPLQVWFEERGRNGVGMLSPCEDGGSSLKDKGLGEQVGDEGAMGLSSTSILSHVENNSSCMLAGESRQRDERGLVAPSLGE